MLALHSNKIGDAGVTALAGACASGALAQLTYLALHKNQISDSGLEALAGALRNKALPALKTLHVDNNSGDSSEEEQRLIKVYLRRFVRNGADLKDEDKDKLRKIDEKLSSLSPKFSSNLRKAINKYELWIDKKEDLKGLPQMAIDAAKEAANAKNKRTSGYLLFNFQAWFQL